MLNEMISLETENANNFSQNRKIFKKIFKHNVKFNNKAFKHINVSHLCHTRGGIM